MASPRNKILLCYLIAIFVLSGVAGCSHLRRQQELIVFAAASLSEAFTELAAAFERERRDLHVVLNFAGSQELRAQIEHGAPVDVFASANRDHVQHLADRRLVDPGVVFAHNDLVIVVPSGNPAVIDGLDSLATVSRLVIAAADVPLGRYTSELLAAAAGKFGPDFPAQVLSNAISEELNARQVLHKIRLGEGNAGIVYRTDAAAAGTEVAVIELPAGLNPVAGYVITVGRNASHPAAAEQFVDFVLSERGQAVLAKYGFLSPAERGGKTVD